MMFEKWYNKVFEAGYNKRALESQEAQNRRLEEMLKYGKLIGRDEGFKEGYFKGYEVGYAEGEQDTMAKHGIIEISGEEFEALTDDIGEAV